MHPRTPRLRVLALGLLPCGVHAQDCAWTIVNTPPPPVVASGGDGAIIFNTATQRLTVVAFLGMAEWDGAAWVGIPGSGLPQSRPYFTAAYDTARQRIVVHGGLVSGAITARDTYEWNGSAWLLVSSAGPYRAHAAMAYDPVHARTVLHGGLESGQAQQSTWAWDGATWTQTQLGGPFRTDHAMVFDPLAGRLVMHGGLNEFGAVMSDMRWYSPTLGWLPLTVTNSPLSADHGMVFDAGRSRMVLFSDATYELVGSSWTRVTWSGPARRGRPLLGYDPVRAVCVLTPSTTWLYPAPAVLSSPGDQTANPGATVTFIAIPGNPAQTSLRWRKDGQPLADNGRITGSGTPTLRIASVTPSDSGVYDMLVTGYCVPGSSAPAVLTVQCYANCDQSTVAPILNVLDFNCFLNRFAAGCP